MPARKKPTNQGQQFFKEVQKAADDSYQSRPIGMPAFEVLKTEMARYGLPENDALYVFDRWLANGFTIGGRKIKNWKAAFRTLYYNGGLPSQRGVIPGPPPEIFPTRERVEFWCTKRKVRPMISRAWGELFTGRFRGRVISNQPDFDAAMEVIKAQWLKEP